MKKNYSKPASIVINIEAEQMIATSGTIEDVPMHGGKSYSNHGNSSFWNEEPFSDGDNSIWK